MQNESPTYEMLLPHDKDPIDASLFDISESIFQTHHYYPYLNPVTDTAPVERYKLYNKPIFNRERYGAAHAARVALFTGVFSNFYLKNFPAQDAELAEYTHRRDEFDAKYGEGNFVKMLQTVAMFANVSRDSDKGAQNPQDNFQTCFEYFTTVYDENGMLEKDEATFFASLLLPAPPSGGSLAWKILQDAVYIDTMSHHNITLCGFEVFQKAHRLRQEPSDNKIVFELLSLSYSARELIARQGGLKKRTTIQVPLLDETTVSSSIPRSFHRRTLEKYQKYNGYSPDTLELALRDLQHFPVLRDYYNHKSFPGQCAQAMKNLCEPLSQEIANTPGLDVMKVRLMDVKYAVEAQLSQHVSSETGTLDLSNPQVAHLKKVVDETVKFSQRLTQAASTQQLMQSIKQYSKICRPQLSWKCASAVEHASAGLLITAAVALVGVIGFVIGGVAGLWMGPGALLTAIAGANTSLVALTGVFSTLGLASASTGVTYADPLKSIGAKLAPNGVFGQRQLLKMHESLSRSIKSIPKVAELEEVRLSRSQSFEFTASPAPEKSL